jgi:hypothetical protein
MQVQILKIARLNSDKRAKPLLKMAKPYFDGPSARAKPFLKIAKPNSYSLLLYTCKANPDTCKAIPDTCKDNPETCKANPDTCKANPDILTPAKPILTAAKSILTPAKPILTPPLSFIVEFFQLLLSYSPNKLFLLPFLYSALFCVLFFVQLLKYSTILQLLNLVFSVAVTWKIVQSGFITAAL